MRRFGRGNRYAVAHSGHARQGSVSTSPAGFATASRRWPWLPPLCWPACQAQRQAGQDARVRPRPASRRPPGRARPRPGGPRSPPPAPRPSSPSPRSGRWWSRTARRSGSTPPRAEANGYTLIDLSDDYTPYIFAEQQDATGKPLPNRYRRVFIGLANDQVDEDGQPLAPGEKNYLELYGVFPSMSVLRARFLDDGGRTCLDENARAALEAVQAVSYIAAGGRAPGGDPHRPAAHRAGGRPAQGAR